MEPVLPGDGAYRRTVAIIDRVDDMRAQVRLWRASGARVGLVPTMGSLHEGHLELARRALRAADKVVASVFVNPLQFGAGEDFESYPRTLEADAVQLQALGVDAVFAPAVSEVYPDGGEVLTRVVVRGLSDVLCGAYRPGHFEGVATVVALLFNLVQPDMAVFGEKDYQQLVVIRRMVRDLHMPIQIIGVPTVREPSGLAMSSRNQYLTADELRRAPVLNRALREAARRIEAGHVDFDAIEAEGMSALTKAGFRPDYFVVRDADALSPPGPEARHLVVLAAAWLGAARLIDNCRVDLVTA